MGRKFFAIRSRFLFPGFGIVALASAIPACSILYTRPVQDMSDTQAAIKAAQDAQADTQAPELYRRANEWFNKAKREYRLKNFKDAKEYAKKARILAEQAEFDAIRNQDSGNSDNSSEPPPPDSAQDNTPPPPPQDDTTTAPNDEPTPTGTPMEDYDQRKAADDAREKQEMDKFNTSSPQQAAPTNATTGTSGGTSGSVPVSTSVPQPAQPENVNPQAPQAIPTTTIQ